MLAALAILIPLLIGLLLLYRNRKPGEDPQESGKLLRFNRLVFLTILLAWLGSAGYFRATTGQSVDRGWWPILSVFSGLLLTSAILLLAALIRNFLFKR
ncbi:MAG: hypothetical protein COV76_06240 [Candidatus Omnitrophica bacterium CG11_big_fil_rev_8_21_14_0_20_64_10]|nr:MAG: hypothetical protein COV76_06240 [Candidatus Omnitrophica bacterium CG11_big_fil_rev_8_21_14_0_20_64_10]